MGGVHGKTQRSVPRCISGRQHIGFARNGCRRYTGPARECRPDTLVTGPLVPSHPTQYSGSCKQDRRMKRVRHCADTEGSMTTATRLGHVLTRVSFGAVTSVGLLALSIVESHPVMAQNHGPAALTGIVSTAEEGKMEGIMVSAKRPGSTIMVSVSTDQGAGGIRGLHRFDQPQFRRNVAL